MSDLGLFDMFGDQMSFFEDEAPKTETKTEEVKAEKKAETKTEVKSTVTETAPADDDEDIFNDDAPITDEDEKKKEAAKKPATKKKSTKKSATVQLTGPVTVIGTGFKYVYGVEGAKVSAQDAVKAAFAAGYKEVADASITTDEKSTVFVDTLSEAESGENVAVADVVTVVIGDVRVEIEAASLGCERDQASVDKVCDKFVELYPNFRGCGLKYDSRTSTAFPVFHKDNAVKFEKTMQYSVYNNGTVTDASGDVFADKEEVKGYKSEDGTVFLCYHGKKTVLGLDFGLDVKNEKRIEEKWDINGLTIFLETFGSELKNFSAEDFGGKTRVSKDDVISYLKPKYSAFKSSSRKVDILYDKGMHRLGVALVSGTKGAALAAPLSFSDGVRTEETAIGTFKGDVDELGRVSNVSFSYRLPKIPYAILDDVIRYFKKDLDNEAMVQIYLNQESGKFYLKTPETPKVSKVKVEYNMSHSWDILVASIHSHNTMKPEFSHVDDRDEIYTGIFGVVGNLDEPDVKHCNFRAGMEGSFVRLKLSDLFEKGGEVA